MLFLRSEIFPREVRFYLIELHGMLAFIFLLGLVVAIDYLHQLDVLFLVHTVSAVAQRYHLLQLFPTVNLDYTCTVCDASPNPASAPAPPGGCDRPGVS